MKTIIIALSLVLVACSSSSNQAGNLLSSTNFESKIKTTTDAQIIDVRTPEEVAEGCIQNAINIDYNSSDFSAKINQLDKNKPTFVYCLSGGRSSGAVEAFKSNGFKTVYELDGGISQWSADGLPIVAPN